MAVGIIDFSGYPAVFIGYNEYSPSSGVDPFSFTNIGGVARSAIVESNVITITGSGIDFPVDAAGDDYRIDAGAWTALAGTISPGQTVQLRVTSGASYSSLTASTLTIDALSTTWTATTLADPDASISGAGLLSLRLGLGL